MKKLRKINDYLAIENREKVQALQKIWRPIEVSGEHQALLGDRVVTEVIDRKAVDAMVYEFDSRDLDPDFPGILVDADHLSHDLDQRTEAQAWVKRLENRGGVLWAQLELTDSGADAIRNKRYKFFSTEYEEASLEDLGEGRVRPLALSGLALTNRPNHQGQKPISNRGESHVSANQEQMKMMKKLAEKLGLPAEAIEEDLLAAVDSLLERAEAADAMEVDAEAEEILNRYTKKISPESRKEWKQSLIANREGTEALLKKLPDLGLDSSKTQGRVFNRSEAGQPGLERAGAQSESEDTTATEAARAKRISNRAHKIKHDEGIPFPAAWKRAEAMED